MSVDRRKTQQWEFVQDSGRRWFWRQLNRDSQTTCSGQGFASRTDCIADAMSHGYLQCVPWLEPEPL